MVKIDQKTDHKSNPRKIVNLVVHCTAGNQYEKLSDLLHGFKLRGWKNPGYHYVIPADGNVIELISEKLIANGVAGHNSQSIHVSYMGGIDKNGKPSDNRTEAQKISLRSVLEQLKKKYPAAKIKGHRDFSPDLDKDGLIEWHEWIKACPCFDAMKEFADLNK